MRRFWDCSEGCAPDDLDCIHNPAYMDEADVCLTCGADEGCCDD
jgi:hypothetical protein